MTRPEQLPGSDTGSARAARSSTPGAGRLRIFFGYAAGLGLRETLLRTALRHREAGVDVVVGSFTADEPNVTRSLLSRFEGLGSENALATGDIDIDAARRRRPRVVLVSPLAHANGSSARHRRRHQDVAELLAVGMDVWTTLEVRELEGLADLCERVTGERVHDRVPDLVFDSADEIDLVDGPVDDLLHRGAAETSASQEERRTALVALREIALRRMADRLHQRLRTPGAPPGDRTLGNTRDRLLVCVGPSPTSAHVIRTAARMATALHAPWTAVHVRSRAHTRPGSAEAVAAHLHLAEELGADTLALDGSDVAEEIVQHARATGTTKILIGKTGRTVRSALLRGTVVDRLLGLGNDLDVYVIRGPEDHERAAPAPRPRLRHAGYLGAAGALGIATLVSFPFAHVGHADAGRTLVYLLAVTYVAATHGRGPSILASFAAVLLFNFFFTEPRFTLVVRDPQYLFTFGVMLVIGLLVSTLTARVREHSDAARMRERRTDALYQLSRNLSGISGRQQILAAAVEHFAAVLRSPVAIWLVADDGSLRLGLADPSLLAEERRMEPVVHWVRESGRLAGAGTDTHGDARVLCLPLATPDGVVGVLAVSREQPARGLAPDERRHLETLAAQVGMAIVRDRLTQRVHRVMARAEAERLRSGLLSSVSHDFRTPLAAIAGTASSLLVAGERIPRAEQDDLLRSIGTEADRLARLVDNLLHLTRIESGRFPLQAEWHVVEDLVGSSLHRVATRLTTHPVETSLVGALPLLRVDGVLVEQALVNLLENAAKFSPPGSGIHVGASIEAGRLVFAVGDRGPGIPDAEKARVFEKFYRGRKDASGVPRGTGLGLAICHAVATLHGGEIWVEDRPGGGALFRFALPVDPQPPEIPAEDAET